MNYAKAFPFKTPYFHETVKAMKVNKITVVNWPQLCSKQKLNILVIFKKRGMYEPNK